ncbi:riboflavin kinase [Niallia sp. 01092]|uniref:riboflavin kinase n=1 Tax=unclassified Niallia TaxID=2837522 RepID=UPI003FD4C0A7
MLTNIHKSYLELKPFFNGRVVSGRKLGRQIGFPTANIDVNVDWLNNGVYGVAVTLDGSTYLGVMNIGVKPTVDANLKKTTEIHLIDFQENIYEKKIKCSVLFHIREEKKFDSLEQLKQQIKEDVIYAKKHFKLKGLLTTNKETYFARKRVFKSS